MKKLLCFIGIKSSNIVPYSSQVSYNLTFIPRFRTIYAMSEIINRLKSLSAQKSILDVQASEESKQYELFRQEQHQIELERVKTCGKLIESLGVPKILQELNSEVLQSKGKIVKAQGTFPHHVDVDLPGIDNGYETHTSYHPISMLKLCWKTSSPIRGNTIIGSEEKLVNVNSRNILRNSENYYVIGVVSGTDLEGKVFWKSFDHGDFHSENQSGSWFVGSNKKDSHTLNDTVTIAEARKTVLDELTEKFFTLSKNYISNTLS